ncbi:MAG: hypothetical protein ACLS27_04785 [Eubacterium sp.]
MKNIVLPIISAVLYLILAPFLGALLAGIDRKSPQECKADRTACSSAALRCNKTMKSKQGYQQSSDALFSRSCFSSL